jgi:alpha-1,2-mannosyltransferase
MSPNGELVRRVPDGRPESRAGSSDSGLPRFTAGGLALLAFVICLANLAHRHALFGIVEYDDGVYLGATLRLFHGALPYRAFDFGHPPGILLLLLPLSIAAYPIGTRALMAAARVQTAVVAAANVFLLARIVRHRGTAAVLVGGLFLAVFPAGVFADRTVMLEPYLILFCLLGVTAMFEGDDLAGGGRMVWAGLAFGFAGAIKIWAIFPAAVALACCAPRLRRHGGPLLLGILAGFGLPSLPFFFLAPSRFIHDVLTVQLERRASGPAQIGGRLVDMIGIPDLPSVRVTVVIAGAYVFVVTAAFFVRPRPTQLDWFALGSASLSAAALLGAPDFFLHYAYFAAAFLALLLGLSVDRLLRVPTRRANRSNWIPSPPTLAAIVLTPIAVFATMRSFTRHDLIDDPGPAISRAVAPGACAVADEPALLIIANRFVPGSSHCPAVVDTFFASLLADPTHLSRAQTDPNLAREWQSWFCRADYIVLSPHRSRVPWTRGFTAWFRKHFREVSSGWATVYRHADPKSPRCKVTGINGS